MASAEELKYTRALHIGKMKSAYKKMGDSVSNHRTRLVDKYHNEVQAAFAEFERVHVQYAIKAKIDLEDVEMISIATAANDCLDLADKMHDNFTEQQEQRAQVSNKEAKMVEEKKQRSKFITELDEFLEYLQGYLDKVEDDDTVINTEALAAEIVYMEEKYKGMMALYDAVLYGTAEREIGEVVQKKAQGEKRYREGLFTLRAYISVKTPQNSQPGSRAGSRRSSPERTERESFRHKKMDFPKFSGILRQYATFKRDFNDMILEPGVYDKKQMSHILRNECLSGDAKNYVHSIYDYDALWAKLDTFYDDEAEVVEEINNQIAGLMRLEEEDYEGFIELVDIVEKAELDLSAMGSTSVLNNPVTVRRIMGKCPRSIKEAMARELDGKKQEEEFDAMLKFLLPRRKDALRLSRVEKDENKTRSVQHSKQKGIFHVCEGNEGREQGGSYEKPWNCMIFECKYKQKHFLNECRAFKKLDATGKGKVLLKKGLCVLCFGNHAVGDCPKKAAGWRQCDIDGCGKWHSRLLHDAVVPGLALHVGENSVAANLTTGRNNTLLLIENIPTASNLDCLTFWDHGSTTSLVTFKYAVAAGLKGVDCCFELTGVGENVSLYSTKLYMIPLISRDGNTVEIHAYGIERITADMKPVNLQDVVDVFKLDSDQLNRPVGPVDLLIGISHVDIMPTKSEVSGKLALYRSYFGTGYILGGILENLNHTEEVDDFAHSVSHAEVRNIRPIDFISAEGFGVDVPRRCKHCKGCKECGFKASQLTWTEANELSHIEKGLTLDTVNRIWTAQYPFHTDPSNLQDNYYQAHACLLSLEKRLSKNQDLEGFNAQFKDAVDRGVFQELSEEDAANYNGPVNYITITEAYKEGEQVTTPLRLCMNSSMKYKGLSLNDLLMKGPSALNSIYSVLLNFRSYAVGFVKDVSKFYQSVLASPRDQHIRRVLWRNGDAAQKPKIFITRTVNFGDKPAGCITITALRETADLYKNLDPEAARKLKDDNYCDDLVTGADTKEEAKKISENMDLIVGHGGFKFKSTIISGDEGEPRRVLGTGWDTQADTLFIEVKVNVSPKRKGIHTMPNIQFDHIRTDFPADCTKRIIWRVVLGQFDLLGLASAFFIRLKLLMRDLSGEDGRRLGWDDPVSTETRDRFVNLLEMTKDIQDLRFPRSIVPGGLNKEKKPDLLVFGDGSKQAFCSLAYIRWEMENGEFQCYLLTGKTRVAPLKKISVPRVELLGAVGAVRLAESVQSSMKLEFGRRFFFTDSSAVFGMIRGDCGSFQEFVGTRTGEIKGKSNPETEWFWLPTKENLADMGTRDDVTPAMLGENSTYLRGLPWMHKKEDEWPVNQSPGKVPDEEMISSARSVMCATVETPLLDLTRFGSFSKVTRIMSLVLKFIDKLQKKYKGASSNILIEKTYTERAENYWFISAQVENRSKFQAGKLSSLLPRAVAVQVQNKPQEMIVTSGRLGGALVVGYDKEELPILDRKSIISALIMKEAHEEEHCGVDRTLWRSRKTAWVVQGKRIAKTVRFNCFKCKLRGKVLERQIMAPLPESRIPPAPAFFSTAVDLFGPISIRDTVKRRTTRKCWGVLFCCTATSAVHLEVSEDYSCDSFLLCLRRFFNLRGTPSRIQSDPGSQLMAAAIELGKWDFSRIQEWTEGRKTEWHFIPADSQHFNGCAEAMIKVTKTQLSESLKSDNFTKGELDTFMSDAAFIVNSRPLMKTAGEDPLSGGPITPLHLLGGRCTMNIPTMNLDCRPSLTKRIRFIEETTKEFWKKWFVQVFHNLVPSYKWRQKYRNVQVGDVVLMKEANLLQCEYKLARVKEVIPGADGHVRRVKLEYRNPNQKKFTEVERSIHTIAVIVPADWSQEETEAAVTSGLQFKCAFKKKKRIR